MIQGRDWNIADLRRAPLALSIAVEEQIRTRAIPAGCLGAMHELGRTLARIKSSATPTVRSAVLFVYSADHGLARHGVSAFPKAATRENTINMAMGGGTISAFARIAGIKVVYCDVGIDGAPIDVKPPGGSLFFDRRVANGTRDCLSESAMTERELSAGMEAGYELCKTIGGQHDAVALGDMGIGNSSTAALLTAALLDLNVESVTGRGSGLGDEGLLRKKEILRNVIERWSLDRKSPEAVLCRMGGHEISAMIGTIIAAAEMRKPILVDGFITAAASLAAFKLEPRIKDYLISTTESTEPGFRAIAAELAFQPILSLGLRLGEGTGAALAWPIIQAAAAYMSEVRCFKELGWVVSRE